MRRLALLAASIAICLAELTVGSAATDMTALVRSSVADARSRHWAVLIGVNEYRDDAIEDLRYAAADAEGVYDVLVDPLQGGFAPSQVTLLTDDSGTAPTRVNIIKALSAVEDAAGPDDTVLVYFSGHGVERDGQPHLLGADAAPALAADTGVALSRLTRIQSECNCRALVIILDACHSGLERGGKEAGGMSLEFQFALYRGAEGTAILSSTGLNEISYEDDQSGHSVFTRYLTEALWGAADATPYGNRDGVVSVTEANRYVVTGVKQWAWAHNRIQNPWLEYRVTGEIALTLASSVATGVQPGTGSSADADMREPSDGDAHDSPRSAQTRAQSLPPGDLYRDTNPTRQASQTDDTDEADDEIVVETTIGSDDQTLVWVPEGRFRIGSTYAEVRHAVETLDAEDRWIQDEQPSTTIALDGFWIGECEITNAQYAAFLNSHDAPDVAGWLDLDASGIRTHRGTHRAKPGLEQCPVMGVTWHGAAAYCEHYRYVLPTEVQWEYAARGPRSRLFPWGNEWDAGKCCVPQRSGLDAGIGPVGSFPDGASWCGALDMAGSAWEWTDSWYSGRYRHQDADVDPIVLDSGNWRVVRGVALSDQAYYCRSAYRGCYSPDYACRFAGFRVVRPTR